MIARNHELTYRPLIGGIEIINPANDRPGTLGAILTDGQARFALSCYHVLCRPDGGTFADREPVLQSIGIRGGGPIGTISAANTSAVLDCAAAAITPGLSIMGRILGIGPLSQPIAAQRGMRVIKSGYATGVTEGEVLSVQGDRVTITRVPGYPAIYEINDFGDSGALWVERASGAPVAMHTSSSPGGNAIGISLIAVLGALGLTLVLDR
jgi:hypothetical protein